MKHLPIILAVLFAVTTAGTAQTLKGGWINIDYESYNVTDKLSYYDLTFHTFGKSASGTLLQIWDAGTGALVDKRSAIPELDTFKIYSNKFSDCINNASLNNPYKDYLEHIGFAVPANAGGYIVTASYEGRDASIVNIYEARYTGMMLRSNIAGIINGVDYHTNSSPLIDFKDTISACINTYFSYRVTASDKDGDSLSYSFGDAINSAIDSTAPHNYPVLYNPSFTGADPLGTGVTIHPVSGLVSGIAPAIPGGYTVAVYVHEWRKGVLINTTRKESTLKIVNCPFAAPLLKPMYTMCRNYRFTFKNEPTCPAITSWFWDFGNLSSVADTSSLPMPSYTYPSVNGTYNLKLRVANNDGYIDSATSIVKIYDSITVNLAKDTAICKTDTIVLRPVSNAPNFLWSESGSASTLSSKTVQFPKVFPSSDSTIYYVTAKLNTCEASSRIKVYASPYPVAKAGADTFICFSGGVTLHAKISGAYFTWSPVPTLLNYNTLQPFARPSVTTTYILTVRDTSYCPKPVSDSVIVKFVPRFYSSAGNDVAVSVGYPFQLTASGDNTKLSYVWQPSSYLNNSNIYNPVGTANASAPSVIPFTVKVSTPEGCFITDEVLVKVFKTGPDILVPSAFTPNRDGRNDVLKPTLIGIGTFDYFNVYNRYGRLVYSTAEMDKGWDGTIENVQQNSGAYVFVTQGKDYLGKTIFKKGTVVLVR